MPEFDPEVRRDLKRKSQSQELLSEYHIHNARDYLAGAHTQMHAYILTCRYS